MPMALHLSGQLDVAALRSALLWILTRHEAVRVVFADRGGALTQAAQPVEAVPWRVADLSGEPPQARAARLMELGAAEAARPFDLAHEPVTRLLLVRLDDAAGRMRRMRSIETTRLACLHRAADSGTMFNAHEREVQ